MPRNIDVDDRLLPEVLMKVLNLKEEDILFCIDAVMTFKPQVYQPPRTATKRTKESNDVKGKPALMNEMFTFPTARKILNLMCLYCKLERTVGNICVQYPVWKRDLTDEHVLMKYFNNKDTYAVMLSVEVDKIEEVLVEEVSIGEKIGAFCENMLYELPVKQVRPVFRCRVAPKHKPYFPDDTILVDVEQLAVDSYARELLQEHI